MDGRSVRLPARALQELLAGRLDQETFLRAHGFLPDEFHEVANNPFETALREGRLITDVELSQATMADDDWVTIRFGNADPAISRIVVPPSTT
jgi:hypothetical protein